MSNSVIVDSLKDLLPILSGLLGVLGIFNVFKSPSNKLTVWGWFAIVVITISSLSGYYMSRVDRITAEKDKQEAQAKVDNILLELERAKHPIGEVKLAAWSILPDSNPEVLAYKNLIKSKIKDWKKLSLFKKQGDKHNGLQVTTYGLNSEPLLFDVDKDSNLWPKNNYPIVSYIASFYTINICVDLQRVKPENFRPIHGDPNSIDWCTADFIPENNVISYDVQKDKLVVMTQMKYTQGLISSNGKFTSVNDLYDSQMFFRPPSFGGSTVRKYLKQQGASDKILKNEDDKTKLLSGIKLSGVIFSFGGGRDISLSGDNMNRFTNNDGSTFFYVTIPNNERDLNKIRFRD